MQRESGTKHDGAACNQESRNCATLVQVREIIVRGKGDKQQAVGVRLADGRVFRGRAVVSNATRWDTFEKLLRHEAMPESERLFRQASPAHSCPDRIWQIQSPLIILSISP
jgi:hypothetical protein